MTITIPETLPEDQEGLRSLLLEAGDELRGLHARRPDTSDTDATRSWQRDVRAATDLIHLADPVLQTMERAGAGTGARGGVGTGTDVGAAGESWGESFIRSAEYEARDQQSGAMRDSHEVRTLLTTDQTATPAAGLWMPRGTPIPPLRRRMRLFVRDLISVVPTGLNSVPYIRELNPSTNEVSATAVAEGTAKPEVTMEFAPFDAPVRKIAAWIPITQEIADDAPTLRGYIDERLAYMLALREEAQILNGNGASPALRGILNTSGIQTQSGGADKMTALGTALGKVENVDGDADGIAMNPVDFWTMITTRSSSQFDVGFSGSGPYGMPPQGAWGVPVVRTRQLASGKALVGAWRLGATLFDREQTVIRTTDSHSDYFVLNKLVILAEERIGLAINRPDLFVDVTLP